MKAEQATLNYYDEHAAEYAQSTVNADMSLHYEHFLGYLKQGAVLLDAGCGSGRDSKYFLEHGYHVHAFDGSQEMCRLASAYTGIQVEQKRFEELDYKHCFDGIWSCASLLHVPREDFESVISGLHNALKDNGILYVSMKYGSQERFDQNNRYFNDVNEMVILLFEHAGFAVMEEYYTEDVRPDSQQKWMNLILRAQQNR